MHTDQLADSRDHAAQHRGLSLDGIIRFMPKLPQPLLEVAWRHRGETSKIHYRVRRPDGSPRHLITREGDALYEVLEQHLNAIGYTGPKTSDEASAEH